MTKEKIIVIVGPTAIGKTALGIELAQLFNGEIISGDSQQVYRNLDIGTAKATQEEQAKARHHLIDVRDVSETYSAYDFVNEAKASIADMSSRGKLPIIVGGTGLYLQSLLEGYHLGGQVDQEQLLSYRQELERHSDQLLFDLLKEKGLTIPECNRRRAIRALELERFGQDLENQAAPYQALIIGLTDDRDAIYQRINQRVDKMLEMGLLEEARWLFDNHPQAQASRGIGYKELFPCFKGEASLEEASELIKRNTRRFAKRQLTWFRNRMTVDFVTITESDFPQSVINKVSSFFEENRWLDKVQAKNML